MSRLEIASEDFADALRKGFGERVGPEGEEVELQDATVSADRREAYITVKLDNGQVFSLEVKEIFP